MSTQHPELKRFPKGINTFFRVGCVIPDTPQWTASSQTVALCLGLKQNRKEGRTKPESIILEKIFTKRSPSICGAHLPTWARPSPWQCIIDCRRRGGEPRSHQLPEVWLAPNQGRHPPWAELSQSFRARFHTCMRSPPNASQAFPGGSTYKLNKYWICRIWWKSTKTVTEWKERGRNTQFLSGKAPASCAKGTVYSIRLWYTTSDCFCCTCTATFFSN